MTTPASLASLLKNLSISNDEPDHLQILKHAEEVLKKDGSNELALRTKVVALLQLDRFDDAVKFLDQNKVPNALLEKAYALYKVGRTDEVSTLSEQQVASSFVQRGLKHVEAQAAYRREDFERANLIYKQLPSGPEAETEAFDLSVNQTATDAQLTLSGRSASASKSKATNEDLANFESAYNAAMIHIGRGEYKQALILLKRSEDICRNIEDYGPEEVEAELVPVLAQRVCVLIKLGELEKAEELAKEIDINSITDASIKVIAINNSILASSDFNKHASLKAFSAAIKEAAFTPSNKPFEFQNKLLQVNEAVYDLKVGKFGAVKTRAASHPGDAQWQALKAIAGGENTSGKELLRKLEPTLEKDKGNTGLALTVAQLRASAGNLTGAIQVLEALLEERKVIEPGVVGLLVRLYHTQGRKKGVAELLAKASEFPSGSTGPGPSVLQAAAIAKLVSTDVPDLESAGALFESLLATDPTNHVAAAGIVASYAGIKPDLAAAHIDKLPSVKSLIKGIDADALEAAGVASLSTKKKSRVRHTIIKPARKRRRLPKKLDPTKKIDEERWWPMSKRSYFKPAKKKGKKSIGAGAHQGGVVNDALQVGTVTSADAPVPEKKASQVISAPKKANKKKKGGKW